MDLRFILSAAADAGRACRVRRMVHFRRAVFRADPPGIFCAGIGVDCGEGSLSDRTRFVSLGRLFQLAVNFGGFFVFCRGAVKSFYGKKRPVSALDWRAFVSGRGSSPAGKDCFVWDFCRGNLVVFPGWTAGWRRTVRDGFLGSGGNL